MTEWPFCCGVRMVLTYDDIDEPELETYFECIYCDKKQVIDAWGTWRNVKNVETSGTVSLFDAHVVHLKNSSG